MARDSVAQIEHITQQLTRRFKRLELHMSDAWTEHELIRGDIRDLFKVYYIWLGEEGIEHKRH